LFDIKEKEYGIAFQFLTDVLENVPHFIAGGSCYRAHVDEPYHKGDDIDIFLFNSERGNPKQKANWIFTQFPSAQMVHIPYCDEKGQYDNQFGQSFNVVMKFWIPEIKKKVDFVFSTDLTIFKDFDSKQNFVRKTFDLDVSMLMYNHNQHSLYSKESIWKDTIYIKNLAHHASYQKTHDRINKYRKINPELRNVLYELNTIVDFKSIRPLDNDPF
jgi:hypothetical protein